MNLEMFLRKLEDERKALILENIEIGKKEDLNLPFYNDKAAYAKSMVNKYRISKIDTIARSANAGNPIEELIKNLLESIVGISRNASDNAVIRHIELEATTKTYDFLLRVSQELEGSNDEILTT